MLDPKWKELTNAYIRTTRVNSQRLTSIREALATLSSRPKLTELAAAIAKIREAAGR